jgi:hypothetical protein
MGSRDSTGVFTGPPVVVGFVEEYSDGCPGWRLLEYIRGFPASSLTCRRSLYCAVLLDGGKGPELEGCHGLHVHALKPVMSAKLA